MAKKINIKGPIVSNDIGQFYHWIGWDACCPNDVAEKLEVAGGEDVIMEINSPGGYCDYGFEIYTMLMEYPGQVTAHIIVAASAASVVACAADEVLVSDAGMFMIHNCSGSGSGDYRDMQSAADALAQYNESIINVYVRKTGKSREELQQMMDNETYMSPARAVDNGFADGYMFGSPDGGDEDTAAANASLMMAVNAYVPLLSDEKAKELTALIKQNCGSMTASEIESHVNSAEKGEKKMTLDEILGEHPEVRDEVNALVDAAAEAGADRERKRLEALDMIAQSVTAEALKEAKYGENTMDAKELAYQALMQDGAMAADYMKNAVEDAEKSGAEDVGAGSLKDAPVDEAEEAAALINKKRGGKR